MNEFATDQNKKQINRYLRMWYFSVVIVIVVYQRESAILPSTVQLTNQLPAVVVNGQTRAVGLTFQETLLPPKFV